MKNKRYVVDTNLLVSAILIRGSLPDQGLKKIESEGGHLVFSEATYLELAEVIMRPKFDRYVSPQQRQDSLMKLNLVGDLVEPERRFDHCRDPKDNKFLDVAYEGQVDALITGDKDLLVLETIERIPIMTLANFLSYS